jgi:hypothetical protein
VKTGVQCFCNALKSLDSGFHRNDDSWAFLTFDEFVIHDSLKRILMKRIFTETEVGIYGTKGKGNNEGGGAAQNAAGETGQCSAYGAAG